VTLYVCVGAAGASVLVTANSSTRGGRLIPLQATARAAVALCPGVRQVLVMPHSPQPLELADNEVDLERVSLCLDSGVQSFRSGSQGINFSAKVE
jgi:acyl-coenzyme A synthetase/AMP-(fatty) acid ligase